MSAYGFFAGYMLFVARKTDRTEPVISEMMALLEGLATDIEAGSAELQIRQKDLASLGRALAGFAGFLQKQILPEALAHRHIDAERELRWAIDTAMDMMTRCLTYAEIGTEDGVLKLTLPPPPKAAE